MHKKNRVRLIVPHREPLGYVGSRVSCTERGPLCLDCPYPKHGFTCWFEDGTCLKTEYNRMTERSGQHMTGSTRTYNKFQGYTTEDCDCAYCLYYEGKGSPCPLPECCCAEEKQMALEREDEIGVGKPNLLCPV